MYPPHVYTHVHTRRCTCLHIDIQVARFSAPDVMREGWSAMTVVEYQCALIFVNTIVRGTIALCKYTKVISNILVMILAIIY